MFVITSEQMKAMDEHQLQKYVAGKREKYRDTLATDEPDLFQTPVFAKWIAEARSFGIATLRDLDYFVELHLQYEAMRARPLHPEFRYTLTLKQMKPTQKVLVLMQKNEDMTATSQEQPYVG